MHDNRQCCPPGYGRQGGSPLALVARLGQQTAARGGPEPHRQRCGSDRCLYRSQRYFGGTARGTGAGVQCVTYYNTLGMSSTVPFEGINVAVITHADGTRTVVKMVR